MILVPVKVPEDFFNHFHDYFLGWSRSLIAQHCREVKSGHNLDDLPITRLQGAPQTKVNGLHVSLVAVESGLGMQVNVLERLDALILLAPLKGDHSVRLDIKGEELLLVWLVVGLAYQNETPLRSLKLLHAAVLWLL